MSTPKALNSRSDVIKATLAALGGNTIFGFSFMFSRVALSVATPFVMLMIRFVLAFAMMSIVVIWAARTKKEGWMRFCLSWRDVLPLVLMGLVQPVIYFLCESYGISMTNATVSGVIIALVPIVVLVAGAVFMGEKPSRKQVAFSVMSIAGVMVMTLQQSADGAILPLGVVLLVGAVISGTTFNILSRRLSGRFSALERTYVMMLVAAIAFTGLALAENWHTPEKLLAPLQDSSFLASMVYLSLFSSILAYLGINYASSVLPVGRISAFCNVTTVLSVFAGVVFLGETITLLSVAASVVIIIGVIGVQKN